MGAALAILGPGIVMDLVAAPSGWRWTRLGLWIVLVASVCWYSLGRPSSGPTPSHTTSAVTANQVPLQDVREVVAATDGRVPAVKALRLRHPGLGLKTAVDLVDAVRPRK